MKTFIQHITKVLFVGIFSFVAACTSTQATDDGLPSKIQLVSKDDGAMVQEFTDTEDVANVIAALNNREQTFEKLMPFFEYKLSFATNDEEQTWHINKAGYVKKSDAPELYKMDVGPIFKKAE